MGSVRFQPSRRSQALLLACVLVATAGCTHNSNTVIGTIPPSTFQFRTVVKQEGLEPGGWQVAQVLVLLGRLSMMFPRASTCQVEVGMPVRNSELGYISVEMAQHESARASDRAASQLLGQREKPTATICKDFRDTMRYFLADRKRGTVAGAKVSKFNNWPGKGVPQRTFPPPRR